MPFHPSTSLQTLLNIEKPIIQAGMIWASGWRLASAVSNAGGLGTIGSGSMYPNVLREHILKCKGATDKPFAVNVPLLYPDIDQHLDSIIELQVPIVITSAGNPKIHTQRLKDNGIKVIHVVSSALFAKKAETAGVDAIVAEGFEAGGHNGREETTSFVLIPLVKQAVSIPIIAAGGIATGNQMFAAMVLGADAVQIGSRFVASDEASCHQDFKKLVVEAGEGATELSLKMLTPVRLLKNDFYKQVVDLQQNCGTKVAFENLLGKGRAKRGMFEGDINQGELEIGQVCALIDKKLPAKLIIEEIWQRYNSLL
jgi:enoyl-[acyl-carrier protein] reductase II